jgi:hypothetical protein
MSEAASVLAAENTCAPKAPSACSAALKERGLFSITNMESPFKSGFLFAMHINYEIKAALKARWG